MTEVAPGAAGPKPRLVCPPGAADCHIHFYGTRAEYPLAPSFLAGPSQFYLRSPEFPDRSQLHPPWTSIRI